MSDMDVATAPIMVADAVVSDGGDATAGILYLPKADRVSGEGGEGGDGKGKGKRKRRINSATFRSSNPRKQGKRLEAETASSLLGTGLLHRLYDTQDWQNLTASSAIMTGKQPADFFWIHAGHIWFIECKSTSRPLPMTVGDKGCNFKPHQLETGASISVHGFPAIHHVHFIAYYPAVRKQAPLGYLIQTTVLYNYWSGVKKAIPLQFIAANSIPVAREKYQKWGLVDALQMTLQRPSLHTWGDE